MKVSKAIKKIVALGVGATMMGATLLAATAVPDLSDYPNFFLDGGNFDGVIVVRGDADSLAAVDIASNMWYAGGGTGGATTTTTVSGDAWLVGTSSKKLEMANTNQSSTSDTIGETFRQINTFIGDDELSALNDGVWKTNEKDYDFQQFLFFDNLDPTTGIVKYSEDDDDVTDVFLYFKNSRHIARYKVEFTTTAQSDVTDSAGSADTTGLFLDDFDNTDLSFWGQSYNVVQAKRTQSGGSGVKLVLMAGSERDTLLEGESATYEIDGEEFDVELSFVDADEAKFIINGEQTNKLKDGDTYTLRSGKEVGVSEILYQDYAGGVHSATFYLGATKLELKDTDVNTATGSTNDLRLGSEDIDGAAVVIEGTDDNTTFSISTIEVNMTTEDDYFVGPGEKLSDVIAAAGEEKEVLFAGAYDIENKGLTAPAMHDIKLKRSSSRRYKLQLYDGDGNAVDIPVAYANDDAGNLSLGEESGLVSRSNQKRLIIWENGISDGNDAVAGEDSVIFKDDYFIVTGGLDTNLNSAASLARATSGSAKSYLLQYRGADKVTKTSPKIKFKHMGDGSTLEYSVTSLTTTGTVATIKLGGYSFLVQNATSTHDGDDFQIEVDLDGAGSIASGDTVPFVDSYGSEWHFNKSASVIGDSIMPIWNNTERIEIHQTTPNADDYDNFVPGGSAKLSAADASGVTLILTATAGPEVRATLQNMTLITPSGETEVSYGYTSMGTSIKLDAPSGDPQELTMSYPEEQALPQIYVTAGATSSSTTTSGGSLARVTIPLTATKLPDEVTNVAAQHVISVGGPCANSVTAAIMYTEQGQAVPANCAEGFNDGEAVVAVYDVGTNVAMVIAGGLGDDTRRAGKVIASRSGELSGTQVLVQGTTASNAEIVKVS